MDKRILKYLAGELSKEEKERFVHDVNTNELLRQDVCLLYTSDAADE